MRVGVLITNGGPHSPQDWAQVTAGQIIDIGSQSPAALLAEARAFEAKIVAVLTRHHELVQQHERSQLGAQGSARLAGDLDPTAHIPDAVDDIVAASRGTSFAAHFAQARVRDYLERLVGGHFASSMHIERLWHADRNPEAEEAKAYKARYHGGAA